MRYFSIRSLRRELYSDNRPIGRVNESQLLYLVRILSRKLIYFEESILAKRSDVLVWSPVNHECSKHSCAVILFLKYYQGKNDIYVEQIQNITTTDNELFELASQRNFRIWSIL